MNILITGAAGFIGSNLSLRLLQNGHKVVGLDNLSYGLRENIPGDVNFYQMDVREKGLYKLFKNVDAVFHLAAKNCISDCQNDPVETADINIHGTINVFEAASKAGVKKIIYAESSALYEESLNFPTPEWDEAPKSFYAISKFAAKYFAKAYHQFKGLNLTALRYFCVYGPAQDYRRTIPPVMSAFIIRLLKGEAPTIYGTGEKRRDFIYIDDVNDFHMLCLTNSLIDNRVFNLGSGINYSINEIYQIISDLLGISITPKRMPDLAGEAIITLADIAEAKKLGWTPKTNIHQGLMNAITYIKSEITKKNI